MKSLTPKHYEKITPGKPILKSIAVIPLKTHSATFLSFLDLLYKRNKERINTGETELQMVS